MIASCDVSEGWLESAAASVVVEVLEALRFRTNQRRQWMQRREREEEGSQREGTGLSVPNDAAWC
jgi:hypothetical protein